MIDVVASERHYADHLAPIWLALPIRLRGRWNVARSIARYVTTLGVPASAIDTTRVSRTSDRPVLVAAIQDLKAARPRRCVFVQHGAGQTYTGVNHGSYSGGPGRDTVDLYLCPGPRDAEILAAAVPETPRTVVGVPKLDRWYRRDVPRGTPPTVAFSFHSDLSVCPETRPAVDHHLPGIRWAVADPRWTVIGHGHPRSWRRARRIWESLEVEAVEHFDAVLERADLYVVDNSSTAYEFAATGRPVLLMNAPWYRRDVEHGLRFWSHVPGLQVDSPADLVDRIAEALDDPPEAQRLRRAALDHVYAPADGRAAERAAAAIAGYLGGTDEPEGPDGAT